MAYTAVYASLVTGHYGPSFSLTSGRDSSIVYPANRCGMNRGTNYETEYSKVHVSPHLINTCYGMVHKAPGPDGLSARVFKECSSEIAPILAFIYNESLAQGNVTDCQILPDDLNSLTQW